MGGWTVLTRSRLLLASKVGRADAPSGPVGEGAIRDPHLPSSAVHELRSADVYQVADQHSISYRRLFGLADVVAEKELRGVVVRKAWEGLGRRHRLQDTDARLYCD